MEALCEWLDAAHLALTNQRQSLSLESAARYLDEWSLRKCSCRNSEPNTH